MEKHKEQVEWQKISCLAGRMYLKIPGDYGKPSDEVAAVKFPLSPRPQEIYIHQEGNKSFTFNLLDKPLQEHQVYPAIMEMQRLMNHAYPEGVWKSPRELKTEALRIGWFGFITGGVKGDSIHCMFVLPVEDNMMFGTFHFPAEGTETDGKIFAEVLRSIRLKEASPMERQGVRSEAGI